MTSARVVEILLAYSKCISKNCRKAKCNKCPLYISNDEKVKALDEASLTLIQLQKIKAEYFNSGIEYAKATFVKSIEREKQNIDNLHKQKEINDFYYTQVLGLQKAIELADGVKADEKLQEKLSKMDKKN